MLVKNEGTTHFYFVVQHYRSLEGQVRKLLLFSFSGYLFSKSDLFFLI